MRDLIEAIKNCQLGVKLDATGWHAHANGVLPVILLMLLLAAMLRLI
jgi:hypothetical protein